MTSRILRCVGVIFTPHAAPLALVFSVGMLRPKVYLPWHCDKVRTGGYTRGEDAPSDAWNRYRVRTPTSRRMSWWVQ